MAEPSLLGTGIYGVVEASRLSGVPARSIRRWVRGYTYPTGESPPVWRRDLPDIDGQVALSFSDLMEVRFVHAFRRYGVSWKIIRLAAEKAAKRFGENHPFSTQRFRTDGRTIFAEVVEQTGEIRLVDVVRDQYAFRHVISPSLYKGIEFSRDGRVARWWLLGEKKDVVIDPARSFGHPITNERGVRTVVLAKAYQVEGSYKLVARWYDVSERTVKDAVAFEELVAHGRKAA